MQSLMNVFFAIMILLSAANAPEVVPAGEPDPYTTVKNACLSVPFHAQVTLDSWDDPAELDPDLFVLFAAYQNGGDWFDESHGFETSEMSDPLVPAPEVEALIQRYFDVDAARIRQSRMYDGDRHAYGIPGMGGVSNCTVTGVDQSGSDLLIHYNHYQDAMLSGSGTLTVSPRADGTFRYTANAFTLLDNGPREPVDALAQSVRYLPDSGVLQLTIPEELPPGYSLFLQASGRADMGGSAMSIHPFESESGSGAWTPGKTYTYAIEPSAVIELAVTIGLQKEGSATVLNEIVVILDGKGNKTFASELQG